MGRVRTTKRRLRRRRGWVVGAVALNLLAVLVLAVVLWPKQTPAAGTSELFRDLAAHRAVRADVRGEPVPPSILKGTTGGAVAEPTPAPEPLLAAPVQEMLIPRIGVNAPLVKLNLTPAGEMDVPKGPREVGWYDFTGKPGLGGNAVFSGHLDYVNYGPAVFWDLKKLGPGDVVDVRLADGTVVHYAVTGAQLYALNTIPMGDVLAPTASESLTIITCGGTFAAGEYSHRLVVRAVRTGITLPGT